MKYFIKLHNNQKHRVRAGEFAEWVERQFAHVVSIVSGRHTIGKMADGVDLYRIDGQLRPFRRIDLIGVSIPSSWQIVERARVFATGGIREAEARQRAIQENCGPLTQKNQFCYPDRKSFGTLAGLAGNNQSSQGETF